MNYTRLHQVMKQNDATDLLVETSSKPYSIDASKTLLEYYLNGYQTNSNYFDPTDFVMLSKQNGHPFFKRKVIRGSSSFHREKDPQHIPYYRKHGPDNNKPRFGNSSE